MKYYLFITTLLTAIFFTNSFAQVEKLKFSGNLYSEQRIRSSDNNPWSWNENRLDLSLQKKSEDKFNFYTNVWMRNITYPDYSTINHLYSKDALYPYNLQLREAYIEIYGFVFKNLDIKIGKQRIAWGKADKLNPTDNVNPYDLEDIWDFGRHNGSEAIRATYYTSHFSIEGVFLPYFKPANLPLGDWASSLGTEFTLEQGLELNNIYTTINQPSLDLKESSQAGLKLNCLISGFDLSLSYLYSRDGLGLPTASTILPVDTQFVNSIPLAINVDINAELSFPRYHIFGFDFAGSAGPFGIWGEMAVFQPVEEGVLSIDLSYLYPQSPVSVMVDSIVLKKESFVKFVLGADYRFGNGYYFNIQYLHGFIHERGKDALNDYFMGQFEKTLYNEKLKLAPLSGGYIVSNWDDTGNNFALIYAPEISYRPNDNAEISISYRMLEGKGKNTFATIKNKDELIFKVRFHF